MTGALNSIPTTSRGITGLRLAPQPGILGTAQSTQAATLLAPNRCRKAPPDNAQTKRVNHIELQPVDMQQAQWGLRTTHAETSPLRYDWQNFAYTDDSVLTQPEENAPGIGAGVYIPPKNLLAAHNSGQGTVVAIDPRDATSRENTINRAELVAIHKAVEQGATHIATDSLGSILPPCPEGGSMIAGSPLAQVYSCIK